MRSWLSIHSLLIQGLVTINSWSGYHSFNSFFVDTFNDYGETPIFMWFFQFILCWYNQDSLLLWNNIANLSIHSLLILSDSGASYPRVFLIFQFILCWYMRVMSLECGAIPSVFQFILCWYVTARTTRSLIWRVSFNSFFVDTLITTFLSMLLFAFFQFILCWYA